MDFYLKAISKILLIFIPYIATTATTIYSPVYGINTPGPEKCSICGINFSAGEKYYYDYWGNSYHDFHVADLGRCYSCNRLVHPEICTTYPHEAGGYQYNDGRYVCNMCIRNGGVIILESDGEQILKETLNAAETMGITIPNIFSVKLVSETELAEIRNSELRPGEKNPALTSLVISRRLLSGGVVNLDTKCDVYLLKGLHKTYFKSCLAHELMHVWLFTNAQFDPEPQLCEGLCNYFAYALLRNEPYSKYNEFYLQTFEQNTDEIYGIGFRRVKTLASQLGSWSNLITFAKYNGKLPPQK